jgi:hypothetical protein
MDVDILKKHGAQYAVKCHSLLQVQGLLGELNDTFLAIVDDMLIHIDVQECANEITIEVEKMP